MDAKGWTPQSWEAAMDELVSAAKAPPASHRTCKSCGAHMATDAGTCPSCGAKWASD